MPSNGLIASEQCPKRGKELNTSVFLKSKSVNENFWFDLLKEKCPEGLGEVDENWFDKIDEPTYTLGNEDKLQVQNAQGREDTTKSDLQLQSSEIAFKTPYKPRKAFTTTAVSSPSLFSPNGASQQLQVPQDVTPKVANKTPCSGDFMDGNETALATPVVYMAHGTQGRKHFHSWKGKSSDPLAEMFSVDDNLRRLTSMLGDDICESFDEWSDSMATPPVKWSDTDKCDSQVKENESGKDMTYKEKKYCSKPVVRMLFHQLACSNNGGDTDDICFLESKGCVENQLKNNKENVINGNKPNQIVNDSKVLEEISKSNYESKDAVPRNSSGLCCLEACSSEILTDYAVAELERSTVKGHSISSGIGTPVLPSHHFSMQFLAHSTPVVPRTKTLNPGSSSETGHFSQHTPVTKHETVIHGQCKQSPIAAEASISSLTFVSPTTSVLENLLETTSDGNTTIEEISQINNMAPSVREQILIADNKNVTCVTDGSPSLSLEQAMVLALDKVSSSCTDDAKFHVDGLQTAISDECLQNDLGTSSLGDEKEATIDKCLPASLSSVQLPKKSRRFSYPTFSQITKSEDVFAGVPEDKTKSCFCETNVIDSALPKRNQNRFRKRVLFGGGDDTYTEANLTKSKNGEEDSLEMVNKVNERLSQSQVVPMQRVESSVFKDSEEVSLLDEDIEKACLAAERNLENLENSSVLACNGPPKVDDAKSDAANSKTTCEPSNRKLISTKELQTVDTSGMQCNKNSMKFTLLCTDEIGHCSRLNTVETCDIKASCFGDESLVNGNQPIHSLCLSEVNKSDATELAVEEEQTVLSSQSTRSDFENNGILDFETVYEKMENTSSQSEQAIRFQGFQTASGKSVTVSQDALVKAKARMLELEKQDVHGNTKSCVKKNKTNSFCGFETPSGKNVTARMLELEKEDADPITKSSDMENPTKSFSGFQTASGKTVTVSKDALIQAQARIMELEKEDADPITKSSDIENPTKSFSGFQTASGKTVTVSKDALIQAKARMLELEKEDADPITKLSDIENPTKSFSGFQTASGKTFTVSKDALIQAQARMLELEKEDADPITKSSDIENPTKSFGGFQTASGKTVTVSEDALIQAKARMLELEKEDANPIKKSSDIENSTNSFGGFQTASGKTVTVSKDALIQAKARMLELEKEGANPIKKSSDIENPTNSFGGFQTASGKTVEVSKYALIHAKARMLELKKNDANPIAKSSDIENPTNSFGGFQTASGKTVTVSKDALIQAKARMLELEKNDAIPIAKSSDIENPTNSFGGFQTASGKTVTVSRDALMKAKARMLELQNDGANHNTKSSDEENPTNGFGCFHTASAKTVTVSKDALIKAKARMLELQNDGANHNTKLSDKENPTNGFGCFHTASGKTVTVSKDALIKVKARMLELEKEDANLNTKSSVKENPTNSFSGFHTASGKTVTVSKDALIKAKARMLELENEVADPNRKSSDKESPLISFGGFETTNEKTVTVSKDALIKANAKMSELEKEDYDPNTKSSERGNKMKSFCGFQTASGKTVTVSEEALIKATARMLELEILDADPKSSERETKAANGFQGFQTENGTTVPISQDALIKAKARMLELEKDDVNPNTKSDKENPTNTFGGFQTASGKTVTVSKDALIKAKARMLELEKDDGNSNKNSSDKENPTNGFCGFETASGKTVTVSKDALIKAKARMMELEKEDANPYRESSGIENPTNRFDGFQTVSERENKTNSFQTASGKTITVSEDALIEAKAQTLELGKESIDRNSKLSTRENKTNSFGGFQTACGKTVTISDAAVLKAKAMLFKLEEDDVVSALKPREYINENDLPVLQHASVKPVAISAEDTCEARIEEGKTDDDHLQISNIHCAPDVINPLLTDDELSREVMESSKALLADDSYIDLSELVGKKSDKCEEVPLTSRDHTLVYDKVNFAENRSETWQCQRKEVRSEPNTENKEISQTQSLQTVNELSTPRNELKASGKRSLLKPQTTTVAGMTCDRRMQTPGSLLRPVLSEMDTMETKCSTPRALTSRGLNIRRSCDSLINTTSGTPKLTRTFRCNATGLPVDVPPIESKSVRARPHFRTPYRTGAPLDTLIQKEESHLSQDDDGPLKKKQRRFEPFDTMASKESEGNEEACGKTVEQSTAKVRPKSGYLYHLRQYGTRIQLQSYVQYEAPHRLVPEKSEELGVCPVVESVTSDNAIIFRFDGSKFFSGEKQESSCGIRTEDGGLLYLGNDGCVGLPEVKRAFLKTPGVDDKLVSSEWIANHYRWIVWKLAAMERSFPSYFAGREIDLIHHRWNVWKLAAMERSFPSYFVGRCLTPQWLLCQLKYRYDREIDRSKRPALRKILERDDLSTRTMVLCASRVHISTSDDENPADTCKEENPKNDKETAKQTNGCVIEVCDGWYSVKAVLDNALSRLLSQGKISVGMKICTSGAELVGSDQAVSPLEAPSCLMLKLHGNSTRRAKWYSKLGYQRHTHPFPLPLSSLYPDGGLVGCVDVIVQRQYPLQWMEKTEDGGSVFRCQRAEERHAKNFELERERQREKLFMRLQDEFEKECLQPGKKRRTRHNRRSFPPNEVGKLVSGREIYEALCSAPDPQTIEEVLDEQQRRALDDYRRAKHEEKRAELQQKFEREWKEHTEKNKERNVVPLLKVRLVNYSTQGEDKTTAMLSVWRPSEEVMSLLSEGSRLRIFHLNATGSRYRQNASEIQLSATRCTRYQSRLAKEGASQRLYVPRQVTSFDCDEIRNSYGLEVDIVGLVVWCSQPSTLSQSGANIQTVYLANEDKNFISVKFWGGLQAFALEDLLKPGCLVAASNLFVRRDERIKWPSVSYSEISTITCKPRATHLRNAWEKLHNSIKNVSSFVAEARGELQEFSQPHHTCTSSSNSSYSKTPGRTAPVEETQFNCRTSNGDQLLKSRAFSADGSRSSTPVNSRSRSVKRKSLDSIPEPPPLRLLHTPIPSSVRREFKPPRRVVTPTQNSP